MIPDTTKENSLAYASFVWRVTIGTDSAQEDILVLTEDAVPGVDFGVIVKVHTRNFARNRMVPVSSVKMKSATLMGRAFGATRMTDALRDPELELSEDGSVRLSDDLITRVKEFTQRLENTYHDAGPPPSPPEAEAQFTKWQNMAFSNVGDRSTYTRREAMRDESGVVSKGDVVIEKPRTPTVKLDGTDSLDGVVTGENLPSGAYRKVQLPEIFVKQESTELRHCRVCDKDMELTSEYIKKFDDECPECHVTCLKPVETPPEGEQG